MSPIQRGIGRLLQLNEARRDLLVDYLPRLLVAVDRFLSGMSSQIGTDKR